MFSGAYLDADVAVQKPQLGNEVTPIFDIEWSSKYAKPVDKDLLGNWRNRSDDLNSSILSMEARMQGKAINAQTLEAYPDLKSVYFERKARDFKMFADGKYSNPKDITFKGNSSAIEKKEKHELTDAIVKELKAAKKDITMINPYVVLPKEIEKELKEAAKRGVNVSLFTNSPISTDSLATQAAFCSDWKRLLKEIPNFKIFVVGTTNKLHAKVFAIDDAATIVSSFNLDNMSAYINAETAVISHSEELNTHIRDNVAKRMKEIGVPLTLEGGFDSIPGATDKAGRLKKMYDWFLSWPVIRDRI